MQGKLIVIDGADGSGKATQTTLLYERLKTEGKMVEKLDFPRYGDNLFGSLIRECLDGKHGDFMKIPPKIASVLYAADRYESSAQIRAWLESGVTVILDRYVSANMMHQGSKIRDEVELTEFLEWLDRIEHGVFDIPRPDAIVYLDVPHTVRKKLVLADATRSTIDLAEQDDLHQIASETCARRIVSSVNNWHIVECAQGDELRPREDIHADIYAVVQEIL